jgi:hypothetical protein
MTTARHLTALVVSESMFRNTAMIADAVAGGLGEAGMDVTCLDIADAPSLDKLDADLLVVGAPTHAFSLSRPATRQDAVRQGAPTERARTGVREWLDAEPGHHWGLAAMFDTRVAKVRKLPKAAGTRGAHLLKRLGFTLVTRPEPFLVEDTQGPLKDGEIERAVDWGRSLAVQTRERLAASASAHGRP